jgi:hypothetical protein
MPVLGRGLDALKKQLPKKGPPRKSTGVKASIDFTGLTRLNTQKRDMRTIEEIQLDLKRKRDGQDASAVVVMDAPNKKTTALVMNAINKKTSSMVGAMDAQRKISIGTMDAQKKKTMAVVDAQRKTNYGTMDAQKKKATALVMDAPIKKISSTASIVDTRKKTEVDVKKKTRIEPNNRHHQDRNTEPDLTDESYVKNNYSDIIRGMFGTRGKPLLLGG